MDYLEDGKTVFRLRLRLCSSLFPVNERIRDFFVEYDRHTLHTSPPWGSELLEVCILLLNSLDGNFCCSFPSRFLPCWVFVFVLNIQAGSPAFAANR